MKKIIKLLITLILLMLIFTACSNNKQSELQENEKKVIKIILWNSYNGNKAKIFDEIVNKYNFSEGIEKNIFIENVSQAGMKTLMGNLNKSVKNELNSYEMPDMFMTYPDILYSLDEKIKLINIRDYFSQDDIKDYKYEFLTDGENKDKKLFVFPVVKATEIMMLNKTYFDEFANKYNVTYNDLLTWESLIDVAKKYYEYTDNKTPNILDDGKAFFSYDSLSNYFLINTYSLGKPIVNENKNEENIIQYYKDTIKKIFFNYYEPSMRGYFYKNSKHSSDDAKVGDVISFVCSSTAISYFAPTVYDNNGMQNIEIKILPVPYFKGYDSYNIRQGAGYSIIKQSPENANKEIACLDFLKWLTNEENSLKLATDLSYLPVKASFYNDDLNLDKLLDDKNIYIDSVKKETLKVSIEELKGNSVYFSLNFKNATTFRNYLGASIRKIIADNLEDMNNRIKNGERKNQIIEEYITDDVFENWFKDFKESINDIIEK